MAKNIGKHQLWFDWIDQFASEFTSTNNFTPEKKRHLVNGVVKDILVSYDQAQKLHRVRVNFRLPVLRSVGEILRADNAVLKRGANSPKESQTLENTGAPERGNSALLHRGGMFSNVHPYEGMGFSLSVNVDYLSSTLWTAPYSDYQQFLFNKINQMHQEGNSYIKIAQWMNGNNHLTPRGSVFKPNHAWSIHMKKQKSIERFTRTFEPEITNIGIDAIP